MKIDPHKRVLCRRCGYHGMIRAWDVAPSAYQDIRCPKCGSTDNEHNTEYQEEFFAQRDKKDASR